MRHGNPSGICIRMLPTAFLLLTIGLTGCEAILPSNGGGQTRVTARPINAADIALPAGYQIEVVAAGLNFPTGVAFDDQDRPCVVEAGYSYGEVFTTPRLVRIDGRAAVTPIATGDNGPWNGVTFHKGNFYVAEGGTTRGGRILRITPEGQIKPLIEKLPSMGDHQTNGPAIGRDGMIYFGVGTATNSGVVGADNAEYGWLKRFPEFHDIPAKDIRLTGQDFASPDPVTGPPGAKVVTGAYSAFGHPSAAGQVVKGQLPCNGAILKIPLDGGEAQLVAWGLRNPYGLAFAADGQLFVTENSYDVRGSRPIWGAGDLLWKIEPGKWYGWPDYHGGEPVSTGRYKPPGGEIAKPLLADTPNPPPTPVARLGVHSSADGFDFSREVAFGYRGEAFIAQFGDMAPKVGKTLAPVGFNIVRVDVSTGVIRAFAVNRGDTNGPASLLKGGGFERPVAARFDRSGAALYVVDFGIMTVDARGPHPQERTGVLWRITRIASPSTSREGTP